MKNINIGLSVSIDSENKSIWTNGILQNVFNLAATLKNSKNNYNVFTVNVANKDIKNLPWGNDSFLKCYKFDDIKDSIDLMIMIGSQIYADWANHIKKRGCKIISYHCGSNYIVDMEKVLFQNEEKPNPLYFSYYDETWLIPQNDKMNFYYFKIMERSKITKTIPFVWSSHFIDRIIKTGQLENNGYYKPTLDKRLSILEPNINVVKYCMYPILIAENLYREDKNLFKHLYVTNSDKIKTNKYFIKLMNHLDIVKDKIATFESRYMTPYFLSKFTDVVISHQWANPLNYAYLDTLYLGYPLIHNADMIKDAGYYYPDSNIDEATKKLKFAIKEHDKNIEEYQFNNKKILNKYSINNEIIIEEYDFLIDNLFKDRKQLKVEEYNKELIEEIKEGDIIFNKYNAYCNEVSDINQHLPTLKRYAEKCDHITEISKIIPTTYAFLCAKPKKMISYIISDNFIDKEVIKDWCLKSEIDYNFKVYETLNTDIEDTDLLFLDTKHTYDIVFKKLNDFKDKINKYIILTDTTTYATIDEFYFNEESSNNEKQGVYNAIIDFIKDNKNWLIKEEFKNNNGLIVLKRKILNE